MPGPIGKRKAALSEINVTPLVDVMLVLLIIFMITAPLMTQGVEIDLPKAKTEVISEDRETLILSLTKDREIFFLQQPVEASALATTLLAHSRIQQGEELLIRADRSLNYGFVVEIFAMLKEAGIEQVGLVTELDRSEKDKDP